MVVREIMRNPSTLGCFSKVELTEFSDILKKGSERKRGVHADSKFCIVIQKNSVQEAGLWGKGEEII